MSDLHPISSPIKLHGRIALVTGAARGIGQAIARSLAREGADLAVADLLPTEETVAAIQALGRRALGLHCDVTNPSEVTSMVEQTVQHFGRIDILVNNAGIAYRGNLEETGEEMWGRDLNVVLGGTYRVTQAVYPLMRRQGYGKIVNIASVSGKIGGAVSKAGDSDEAMRGRTGPAYAAAKGGVLAFTRWVAKDGGRYGITCNAVCPGATETEMTRGFDYNVAGLPIARMGRPEDIAEAVVFLASPAANYITGQALNVDGGMVMD